MELLADFKADLDQGYAQGMTALHWASQEGHLAVVQVLLKVGADVEAKYRGGNTNLHLASYSGACCGVADAAGARRRHRGEE